MMSRVAAYLTAFAVCCAAASAQQGENPIPSSGGAIIMKKSLPDPLEAGWEGEKVCELLQETDKVRALQCTFPPGVGHERHFHSAHFGYILEGGTMRIKDANGTREQETPAGASWTSDGVDWHEALNIGDTTTVYIIVEPKRTGKE
jgi:quercetin dioxygenase-like cupin family protein